MNIDDERIREAIQHTEILRPPKQSLSTFGVTNIYYYLVTEPVYSELTKDAIETVIREGRVIAERKYFDMLVKMQGANAPGLFYTYKNEPKELSIVSDDLPSVVKKIDADIDKRGDLLTSIIRGEDDLWDVSLMKFIYELTRNSLQNNLRQMGTRGLLDTDAGGIPADVRLRINELFRRVWRGEYEPYELKAELDRWGLFEEYEDRFLSIFRKKRR